ncbi:MAG: carboxypeptidase-like regulatory domain-containing protein [Pseudomonadota bacterium]
MKNLFKLLAVTALLLLHACTATPVRDWPAQEGRVLDAQTGQPIEGAFVVMRWIGYGGYSQSQCFHVDVAETDAQGRFRIPEWHNDQRSATLVDQRRNIDVVHKPGYRFAERTYREQSQKQGVWYLEVDASNTEERLKYLSQNSGLASCAESGRSKKNLLSLYRSLYGEAKTIAGLATEQKKIVEFLLYDLEIVEFGYEQATDRHLERRGY